MPKLIYKLNFTMAVDVTVSVVMVKQWVLPVVWMEEILQWQKYYSGRNITVAEILQWQKYNSGRNTLVCISYDFKT